jgi:hypothetical protein
MIFYKKERKEKKRKERKKERKKVPTTSMSWIKNMFISKHAIISQEPDRSERQLIQQV